VNALLIDGSGLAYRSYYAFVRNPLRNSSGEETSLTFGFLNTLLGVLQRYEPAHAAVVFDAPGRSFRHDIDPDYKAGRPPMPESMRKQLPRLREALGLLRLPILEVPGIEADDVLGTLAARLAARGEQVWVLTADKDFFQILDERIKLIRFKRVAGDLQEYGPREFQDDTTLRPEQMVDFLALCGDAVDNVPGIAGIGEKTARKLIHDYGSLETLLARLDEIDKPALQRKLVEGRDAALRSQELVRILTDVDLPTPLADLEWQEPDWPGVRTLLRQLEFLQLLKSLPQAMEESSPQRAVVSVRDQAAWEQAVQRLQGPTVLALHGITRRPDTREGPIRGVALAAGDFACVVHLADTSPRVPAMATLFDVPTAAGGVERKPFVRGLQALLDAPGLLLVGCDLKHDLFLLEDEGLVFRGRLFDVMVADWLLHPNRRAHDLATAALEHLQRPLPSVADRTGLKGPDQEAASPEQIDPWGGAAVDALLQLQETLQPVLGAEDLESLFADVEMPLVRVLLSMERTGVKVDRRVLQRLAEELQERTRELETAIHTAAGHPFNIQSPRQLGSVLFEELGLPHGKRTRTGWSTDSDVLDRLAEEHELPRQVLEYRQLSKLQSTYAEALPKLVQPHSGRIHTRFNQAVASTGRLSSSEPNLQNIPIRTELGRRIRAAFVPEDAESCLLSADYSQIELRIMAHLSQDRGLLQAFREGGDIHTLTAARIEGCDPQEVSPQLRASAKTVNFGVLYGMGARGLSRQLGIPVAEARAFIEEYFATYPGVRAYINHAIDRARTQGFVTTLLGRRLPLPDLVSTHPAQRAFAERVAINAPIQGSAADLIKVAMVRVHRHMQNEELRARMILQVHDELLFDCPLEEADALRNLVVDEMENAMQLSVPLVVDVGRGANWDEAH